MNYQGKTIWITGASSGIGEAFARAFYKEGANLILSSRREDALLEVKESLGDDTENVKIVMVDLTDTDSFPKKATEAIAAFGQIDVLVNNGGVSQRSTVLDSEMST